MHCQYNESKKQGKTLAKNLSYHKFRMIYFVLYCILDHYQNLTDVLYATPHPSKKNISTKEALKNSCIQLRNSW